MRSRETRLTVRAGRERRPSRSPRNCAGAAVKSARTPSGGCCTRWTSPSRPIGRTSNRASSANAAIGPGAIGGGSQLHLDNQDQDRIDRVRQAQLPDLREGPSSSRQRDGIAEHPRTGFYRSGPTPSNLTTRGSYGNCEVVFASSLKTKAIALSKHKRDRVDACMLARLLRCGFLPEVWIPDADTRAARSLAERRSSLVRHGTWAKNRIHGLLHERLIQASFDPFTWGRRSAVRRGIHVPGRDDAAECRGQRAIWATHQLCR